jgi:hypothetical protein
MSEEKYRGGSIFEQTSSEILFEELPSDTKQWAESLPWEQRRHLLLLCHLICVSSPEIQAEFLDNYTADGLVSRKLQDRDTQYTVKKYLDNLKLKPNSMTWFFAAILNNFMFIRLKIYVTNLNFILKSSFVW